MTVNLEKMTRKELQDLREKLNTKLSFEGYALDRTYKAIEEDAAKPRVFELPVTLVLTITYYIDGDEVIVNASTGLKGKKNATIAGIPLSLFDIEPPDDIEYEYSAALKKEKQKLQDRLNTFFDEWQEGN